MPNASALTRFEAGVRFADHEDLATAANDFAIAVTGLRRLKGGQDLHGNLGENTVNVEWNERWPVTRRDGLRARAENLAGKYSG
jgi:hypothetical protein